MNQNEAELDVGKIQGLRTVGGELTVWGRTATASVKNTLK